MKKSQLIRKIRKSIGISQLELCELLNITQPYLSYLECGIRSPSPKLAYKIKKIANIHGIDINLEDII